MGKAAGRVSEQRLPTDRRRGITSLDWRQKMSDHVAYALLVYTGLQIFVTVTVLKSGQGSILPYFALVILVAAIVPAYRLIDHRWRSLDERTAADPALAERFRRDVAVLWLGAAGVPLALAVTFKGAAALS